MADRLMAGVDDVEATDEEGEEPYEVLRAKKGDCCCCCCCCWKFGGICNGVGAVKEPIHETSCGGTPGNNVCLVGETIAKDEDEEDCGGGMTKVIGMAGESVKVSSSSSSPSLNAAEEPAAAAALL